MMHWQAILQLSSDEIARLVALNQRLIEMEYWIFQRAQLLAEDHLRQCRCKRTEPHWEDFEMECTITYVGPEIEDSDNAVLRCQFVRICALKWFFTQKDDDRDVDFIQQYFQFSWDDGITEIEALASQRICWSFHDLHDHHNLTWTDILQIEGVWVDVHSIDQLMTRFPELMAKQ